MNKTIRGQNQHYDIWLQWNLTSQCNFGCTYCFGKTPPNRQTINSINVDKLIQVLASDGRIFRIGFTGGEPFLIPNFIDACVAITERHFVSMNSNLIPDSVVSFADRIDPNRILNVHASLHFEELLSKGLFEKFISNYKRLKQKGFNVYAEAVAYPGTARKINEYTDLMNKYKIEFRFAPFFGEFNGSFYPESYTVEQAEIFGLDKRDINAHNQKGNYCNAGFSAAVISPKGKISPCFNLSGSLGQIYKSIQLNNEPTVCPASRCVCPLNHYDEYLFGKMRIPDQN